MAVERVATRGEVGVPIGVEESSHSRRQRPAMAPLFLAHVNRYGAERLIPALTESTPGQRIEKAIAVFEKLARFEEETRKPQREWSLRYFQACQKGPKARRDFLIEEGVFSDGEYLYCPESVRCQMEIANLNPDVYPFPLSEEVERLVLGMFGEYDGVKYALSAPSVADVVASMRRMSPLGALLDKAHLPSPKLRDSLLIKPYTDRIIQEAKRSGGKNVIAILGPGSGRELVRLTQAENISGILCLDAHAGRILRPMIKQTFEQAGVRLPAIEIVDGLGQIDEPYLENAIQKADGRPVIFLCRIDFSKEEIPANLHKIAGAAACIYVLHESDREGQEAILKNMAYLSRGSVIAYDGLPTCEALDNVILPVSDSLRVPWTGHDSVVTHLLCSPPDRLREVAEEAGAGLRWEVGIEKPPIGAPFLYPLQVRAIGRVR